MKRKTYLLMFGIVVLIIGASALYYATRMHVIEAMQADTEINTAVIVLLKVTGMYALIAFSYVQYDRNLEINADVGAFERQSKLLLQNVFYGILAVVPIFICIFMLQILPFAILEPLIKFGFLPDYPRSINTLYGIYYHQIVFFTFLQSCCAIIAIQIGILVRSQLHAKL